LAQALEFEEGFESAGVGAFQTGFVAIEEWERWAKGEVAIGEAERGNIVVRLVPFVELVFLLEDFFFEEIGFDGPQAALSPFGGDHFFEEIELGLTLGLELLDVGIQHFAMLFGGFLLEDDAFGIEAVRDGVHGGCFAAGFGLGAVRFSAVGTGGINFSWG